MLRTDELFSFVIPIHNGEGTLLACLKSIVSQDYANIEIIAVDNASTDKTKEIILSFPNIRYIYESKKGRSFARNSGAKASSGKYVCFVDCDVILEKDWLTQCHSYLGSYPVDFLATSVIPRGEDSIVDSYRYLFADWKSHSSFLSVRKRDIFFPVINTSASIVLKDSLIEIGFFDESLKRNEDLDLSMRFFLKGFLLGAVSKAQAGVFFVSDAKRFRWVSYLKREYDVHREALFPSRGLQLIHFKICLHILKTTFSKKLRLAGYSILLFLAGNSGVVLRLFGDRKTNFQYSMKRGNNAQFTFYDHGGKFLLMKKGVNFLFCDDDILYSTDFNLMDLKGLDSKLQMIIKKLLRKERLEEEEVFILEGSNLFDQVLV